ncbi:MAG: hypothetical protein ABIM50_02740 [Novosphingobium sp.]
MNLHNFARAAAAAALLQPGAVSADTVPAPVALSALTRVGDVSDRFLSYNIEMVEVTGGRFWRPYDSPGADRYEYRPPIDLGNPRLRGLAAALAPAYVRYSGTWANATWFSDTENAPAKPPAGFDTVLTREQWRGAVQFAKAVNARIVTSFAVSAGTHNAQGLWRPELANRWLAYTRSVGGTIAATEFGNEPNSLSLLKPPAGYTIADYRRDYGIFAGWLRKASPRTLLLAPGNAELGEPIRTAYRAQPEGRTEASDLLTTSDPKPDAVSFHFYGSASERCGGSILKRTPAQALDAKWFAAIDAGIARTATLRDSVAPGAPLWDTESAETVCGGNRIASTFADSFRFLDQLGRSARQGVAVFIHNTLAASDYGLIDGQTLEPRPNYWSAVLWKRTMGSRVLAAPASPSISMHLYAHCLRGRPGGVTLLAINMGATGQSLSVGKAVVWSLTGTPLDTREVRINGLSPRTDGAGRLSGLAGAAVDGAVQVPGLSIAFITVRQAGNPVCR